MEQIISLIQKNGVWAFLTGVIVCLVLGGIKLLTRKLVYRTEKTEEQISKIETIFDISFFFGNILLSFVGALVLYPIINAGFDFLGVLALMLPVYLSATAVYGLWKKGGIKSVVQMVLKLFIKDSDGDGEITLDEALSQIKEAITNGKLDTEKLLEDLTNNANESFDSIVEEVVTEAASNKEEATDEVVTETTDKTDEVVMVSEDQTIDV